ncbi:unnamed protein product [Nezara viridula]|uniref:Uncharacterized protein n=1 Tax=Nezara viridula TaxID=85310 RepID=A0A9P0HGG2_NEZVI|nr:unnamed protein product [Nezara viridula]
MQRKLTTYRNHQAQLLYHHNNPPIECSRLLNLLESGRDKIETSALHPWSHLETMVCEPEAPIDTQPHGILITEETTDANPGQPKEGSYIIAGLDGKNDYRYVCS